MQTRITWQAAEETQTPNWDLSIISDKKESIDYFFEQFISLLPNIINLLTTGASFLGAWLIYRGIRNSIREVSHITPDMKRSNLIRHLIAGTFLISIPFHLSTLDETFFIQATSQDLATAIDQGFYQKVIDIKGNKDSKYFYDATLAAAFSAVTMILGLFAFIKGFYLISQREENGSTVQKETSASSIATHIFGGFLLTQMWRMTV